MCVNSVNKLTIFYTREGNISLEKGRNWYLLKNSLMSYADFIENSQNQAVFLSVTVGQTLFSQETL